MARYRVKIGVMRIEIRPGEIVRPGFDFEVEEGAPGFEGALKKPLDIARLLCAELDKQEKPDGRTP